MFWTDKLLLRVSTELRSLVMFELAAADNASLSLSDPSDLKSHHRADDLLSQRIIDWWQASKLPVALLMEGEAPRMPAHGEAVGSLLIDPIDGSLNRDLSVGDPGFVLAVAESPRPRFRDISGGFVLGLRSWDSYHTASGQLVWTPHGGRPRNVRCDSQVRQLESAILYYNDGYGQNFARAALRRAGFLPLHVRHHNAFDNTALELAQICRGAAHLRVEARSYLHKGVRRGSDHANILPAFALGRPAGLCIGDLNGTSLDGMEIEMDRAQDFLVASSPELFAAAVEFLSDNLGACPLRRLCEERSEPQRASFDIILENKE